jgi:hypothetical protein
MMEQITLSAVRTINLENTTCVDSGHTSAIASFLETYLPMTPKRSAPNDVGDFDKFTGFMRRLVAVPYSEIKAKLDTEKAARKRKAKSSASLRSCL